MVCQYDKIQPPQFAAHIKTSSEVSILSGFIGYALAYNHRLQMN